MPYHISNNKIYSRNINPNLLLIIEDNLYNGDKNNTANVVLKVLDSLTGNILSNIQLENFEPNSLVVKFSENIIIISYNKKDKNNYRQEIISLEILNTGIEDSLLQILNKVYNKYFNAYTSINPKSSNLNDFKNYNLISDYVIISKTYYYPRKIKDIYFARSKLGITNSTILLLLENNSIVFLGWKMFSPRRAYINKQAKNVNDVYNNLKGESLYFDYESLPPYNFELPLDTKNILNSQNYYNSIVDKVNIQSTVLESTFNLCSVGSSIICYKYHPDKIYDSLPSSFSFDLIIGFLIGLFVSCYYFITKYLILIN